MRGTRMLRNRLKLMSWMVRKREGEVERLWKGRREDQGEVNQ